MKKMNEMYELKITDRRWIAYDIYTYYVICYPGDCNVCRSGR